MEQAIVREPLTISANATVAEAIALMSSSTKTCNLLRNIDSELSLQLTCAQSCILVTEANQLVGILTERDLIKLCGQIENAEHSQGASLGQNLSETAIAEVMTYPVHSLLEWEFTDIFVAINRFQRYNVRHLPLVNERGEVSGLITHASLRQLLRPIDMLRLLVASEVMVTDVVYAQATDSVAQIANLMSAHKVSSVVIVESRNHSLFPLGIITESDIVQYLALELNLAQTQAQMVMSFPVISVPPDETLWTVREVMQERMSNHVVVANPDGEMRGIVTQSSILKTLQPMEVYKLVSKLEVQMSQLEQEKIELLESRNRLLEGQVKASTDALIDSNDMFRQFAENNQGIIVIREIASGKVLYVSPVYEEIWGKSCESLYQDPNSWLYSLHPDDRDRIIQIYTAKAHTGYFSEEYRIIRPDGLMRWIWGRCFPVKNTRGEIYRIAAIIEDISDRKNAEIALKESEQRLKASEFLLGSMFECSAVGMAITDSDGKYIRTNPCYQQMVGYSESELREMRFTDNMLPEDIEENLRLRDRVLTGENASYQMEKRLLHKNGHIIWVRTTSSKIADDGNAQPLFIGVIENISDRKQAEESLQSLVEGASTQIGDNFLPALVEYIANILEIRYVSITKICEDRLKMMAVWLDGQLQPVSETTIPLVDSPCAITVAEGKFYITEHLQQQFPDCNSIKQLGANSYLGIAINNSKGDVIGCLCILNNQPIQNMQRANAMLQVFAPRVSAEMERQEAIAELYHLNQQLESRVEQRTRELKFANQQLIVEMAERQKLITLVENSTDFIALADCNGRLNYVNSAGRELLGLPANTQFLSIFDLHFPEDHQVVKRNILDLIAQDETWEGEFRLRHYQTNDVIPVLFSAFPIQNSWIDETLSLACIVRDISDRKKSEETLLTTNEELINANKELARATRLKDEFLANMSHELRTPLNAILGMSEGLLSSVFGDLNERQKRSLNLIESSGRHLLELINDILDVAKIGAGKMKLDIAPVSIEYLCKSSLGFVKQMASQKNIQLRLAIQPELGLIELDERRIRQALINLLSNAVKFTPASGKICLEVKFISSEETALPVNANFPYALIFSVIDTGIGIAPEDIGKLFQTFVQIDSSLSRQYTGTGLGLTLVKQIAELHGGCVGVTSQVGEGSCFSIALPHTGKLRNHNNDDRFTYSLVNQKPNQNLEDNLDDNLNKDGSIYPLILLAEDNPTNVETFADYLSNRGYRLIIAANGQEAVDMAIAHIPDLILMDIQMPVLDGLGAIKQIRANVDIQHIPIIALTALAMKSDQEQCLQAGADEFLAKPVKLALLATTIQQQINKSRDYSTLRSEPKQEIF
ncbi:PAS domain S-box protein [Pseudanabaena yagii]|uniref:histidine kinase n=1 Tax=Pseudanabaena yagii GIHE-NHR1 TaxID=2722753 RepID=A0ABX1LVD5_9CYAN|nr:PAS domain S-box protein [Pseudanabaena yagii]NMF60128.1 PAS domain S-box protein [Pseudanabaena yagii GIHE-NHR1]